MDHSNTEPHLFASTPNWYDRLMSIPAIFVIALSILWAAFLIFGVARLGYCALA